MKKVENILKKYEYEISNTIQILEEVQKEYNYLPKEILEYISQRLKIPLSKIYSFVTFYTAFHLNPRGKHLITVCIGTACHVRGAAMILNEFERRLNIKSGETTGDMSYTLETVNCLGCCAIGPIVVYDGKYTGEFKLKDVASLLKEK